MSSSPKFRIIVHGVAAGADPQRVRRALAARLGTEAAQLDQLLQNQGGALAELLDHQTAWKLKNLLQQLEVDCRIAPVPLSGLGAVSSKMTLQVPPNDRHVGHAPRVQRAGRQPVAARSGKALTPLKIRPVSPDSSHSFWRIVAVIACAFVLGWYFQPGRHALQDAVVVAGAAH